MTRRDALALGPIWLGSCVSAVLVSGAGPQAAVLPAVIAAVVVACGWRWPASRPLAAVCALAVSAVEPALVLPWTIAALGLSLAVVDRARIAAGTSIDELDRYLARCRRREEAATALFVDVRADARTVRDLLRTARVTDSLVVRQTRSRTEVYGLLDGSDVVREAVEARFSAQLDGLAPSFGWAEFPADGLTLDVLLERARGSASSTSPSFARPVAQSPAPELVLRLAFDQEATGA